MSLVLDDPMRQTTIALNLIVAVFFTGFLAYTVVARSHLDSLARAFVTEKTLHYSAPIVELAEEALESPLVIKILSEDQQGAIRREVADYRKDPPAYIADLTRVSRRIADENADLPKLAKVAAIKERIRTFYDNTLAALVADLRIFAFSNLAAALGALVLAYRSRTKVQRSLVGFSFLMFASVFYSSYLYVDDLTFFRILFRTHMGWWYPVFMAFVCLGLYLEYGRYFISPTPNEDEGPSSDSANGESQQPTDIVGTTKSHATP